jgi:DNA-binding MarR family transcriptional regulator
MWNSLRVSARKGTGNNELAGTLAAEIRAVYRTLKVRVREQNGSEALTPSQIAVLVRLEKGGATTVSSLARAEGMRPQSMREVVLPLQDAGFLRSVRDPNDGRQTLLSLTPKCVKWIQAGRAASHDWLTASIAEKLSTAEQKKLKDAFELLRRLVED